MVIKQNNIGPNLDMFVLEAIIESRTTTTLGCFYSLNPTSQSGVCLVLIKVHCFFRIILPYVAIIIKLYYGIKFAMDE